MELEIFEGTPDHYARELDNHGPRHTGVTIIPDQERNILSADPARRAAGVDHMKWAVDCAAALGAEILCGPSYQPLGQFTGTGPTAEEQQRAADAHRAAAEYAAQVIRRCKSMLDGNGRRLMWGWVCEARSRDA